MSAFRIQELTGDRRNIRLVDRALPYRPFRLTTKQRAEVDWNGGYDQGTVNVMGAMEEPTTINGMWKDMFIADPQGRPWQLNGSPILTVREAVQLMEDICRSGQLLQVSWDVQLRHGILSEFEASWENENDVAYTMKFDWTSRGQAIVPVVVAGTSVSSAAGSFRAGLRDVQLARVPPFPMAARLLKLINNGADNITSVISGMLDSAQAYSAQALQPFAAVQRMITSSQALIGIIGEFVLQLESNVIGAYNNTVAIGDLPETFRLQAVQYVQEFKRVLRSLRRTAIQTTTDLFPQIQNQVLAIHEAVAGQHLREVSSKFYATPNNWQAIMHYNGLTTPELVLGQIVLVPKPEFVAAAGSMC